VETNLKASRENIKMKPLEGEVKMAVLGDSPSTEEYLQHLNAFQRMILRKKLDEKMTKWTKAVVIAAALARKLERIPKEETEDQTFRRLGLLLGFLDWTRKHVSVSDTEMCFRVGT